MSRLPKFRGYIGTREYNGQRVPHHVQNLVVRDFCEREGSQYLLSLVEYAIQGSYMMLEEALRELDKIDGIVLYSIFLLPEDSIYRRQLYKRIIASNSSLHGALENLTINDEISSKKVEDIISINELLRNDNSVKIPNY